MTPLEKYGDIKVQGMLLDTPLAPPWRRPIVAIDEAQVWTDD